MRTLIARADGYYTDRVIQLLRWYLRTVRHDRRC